jgi:hypothetical protein
MSMRYRLGVLAAGAGLLASGLATTSAGASGATLSGTVYSHLGSGLVGTTVTVYAPLGHLPAGSDPYDWAPVATTLTGTGGSFSITGLSDLQTYRLKAMPANRATDSYGYWVDDTYITPWLNLAGNVTTGAAPHIRLTEPAAASGTVTDMATGKGISGVEVRALSGAIVNDTNDDPSGPGTPSYGKDFLSTFTDNKGHYVLTGLPSQAVDPAQVVYGLVFTDPSGKHGPWMWWLGYYGAPQFTPSFVGTPGAPAVRNVQLTPSGVLQVHVQDGKGRPVPGLLVQPDSAFVYPYQVTDKYGDINIGGRSGRDPVTAFVRDPNALADPTHSYRITYYGQSPNWAGSTKVLVPDGKTVKITITVLHDAASVYGYALDQSSNPVAGPDSSVAVFKTADTPLPNSQDLQWRLQMEGIYGLSDGWFMVTGLWPGVDLTAYVTPPANWQYYWHIPTLLPNESRDLGTIQGP